MSFCIWFLVQEVSGRIIRVEFAKRLKRPAPPSSQPIVPSRETRHKLYVSNLAWKVRSSHLREFFSAFNPVSARVIFSTPSGQSAGYGFVSFSTREEAEAAISTLNEKVIKFNLSFCTTFCLCLESTIQSIDHKCCLM